ncbi:class I SAM-dependent methyltransferase [Micromonospora sp. NPDC007230]|uniref:class I SAM-dependent methyltransferase n=1 Tax=Micromonospora sp. NPDC007230 TaxID=3364237 RepID=UPI0036A14D7F
MPGLADCGSGPLSAALRERRAIVTGFDSSPAMVELAERRLGEDATLLVADLSEPLPFADGPSTSTSTSARSRAASCAGAMDAAWETRPHLGAGRLPRRLKAVRYPPKMARQVLAACATAFRCWARRPPFRTRGISRPADRQPVPIDAFSW